MPHPFRPTRPAALGAALLLAAGCGAPDAALAPVAVDAPAVRSLAGSEGPRLLACAPVASAATEGLIGVLGGVLDLGANRVEVPPDAVLDLHTFSLEVLEGERAAVDVHATGFASFLFERPITVTIDISHCPASDTPLTVWHVDEATGAFLENMGGVTDAARRTITFQTSHLSIYAVAN